MKKRDEEDKIPLTEIPPRITQETKARFESLLNAALNNESSNAPSKIDDHCVIEIEKSDPPKPCPRTVTLKRKEILLPAGNNHSRGGSSTSSKSSDDVFSPGLQKNSKRSQLVHSAEVHTSPKHLGDSPRQSLLSSPEQSSVSSSSRKKPQVLPRSTTLVAEIPPTTLVAEMPPTTFVAEKLPTTGWENVSDTESSEVVTELKLNTQQDKSELSTTEILEQVISSDTSDLVVAKMVEVSRKSSISDEKVEDSPLKVKVPIPLPRRSLTTSQKSGSTSDERSAKKAEIDLENERKRASAASLNLLSSSSHEESVVTRKKIKRKKKTKKHEASEQVGTELAEIHSSAKSVSQKDIIDKQPKTSVTTMMGVTIHGTDSLEPHTLLRHPMVRVHIVDSTCGEYLKKSDPNRCVSFCEEDVDYILPIMTRHYDFKENRTLTPQWEEVLIFNEDISHIVNPDTLLFFEIVDFVNFTIGGMRYQRLGHDSGWHYVAWAFLKLVAVTGETNTEKKLRLQLYKPNVRYNVHRKQTSPVVFDWWKEGVRYAKKYSSTLYVTVGAVTPPPAPLTPNLRSRVALQTEQGSVRGGDGGSITPAFFTDNEDELDSSARKNDRRPSSPIEPPVTWTRLPAQSCKLTNTRLANIPIAPSGGFSLAFSHSGLLLACGTSGPIHIYAVPSFKLKTTLSGHKGLVYVVRWSSDDHYLVSASADCTACVWDIRRGHALQVLSHPSFVYCASFVAHYGRRALVTGCCDGAVRVWRQVQSAASRYTLVQELAHGHTGFVGALCVDSDGLTLFSGDSFGQIMVWTCDTHCVEWTCSKEVKLRELRGVVINNLVLHPGGNRLLIHSRDSMLRMVDIPSFAVIQWFHGCMNEHMMQGCCVSPCGSLVLACSEDGLMCAWDSNTGAQRALYAHLFATRAPAAVAYHPHEHMCAVVAHTPHPAAPQPLIVAGYDRSSSGEGMNLRLLEQETNQPLQLRDSKSDSKNNEDIWQKLERSSSSHRLDSARLDSARLSSQLEESSIQTSQTIEDNRLLRPFATNNTLIKRKTKKKRLEKKESSWSKLTKTSGFLVEVTTNKGELNRGFEIDSFTTKSTENLLDNMCNRNNGGGDALKLDKNLSNPNKLADIIERMDKVLLAANNHS
ncbi:jouberin-like [Nilaparvata lugens]|uniref:jouberin-like n=1 Tax=Nilaparvata lugens TaxID=108931 RepID=UPI00193D51E9|nr:jouberin-like [Nilaparvata lugens]